MGEKRYDEYVKRNDLHIKKYSWYLGGAYAALSLNTCIVYIWSPIKPIWSLILGILFLIMIPLAVTDSRRQNRELLAVIGTWGVTIGVTVLCAEAYNCQIAYAALAVELLIVILSIIVLRVRRNTRL